MTLHGVPSFLPPQAGPSLSLAPPQLGLLASFAPPQLGEPLGLPCTPTHRIASPAPARIFEAPPPSPLASARLTSPMAQRPVSARCSHSLRESSLLRGGRPVASPFGLASNWGEPPMRKKSCAAPSVSPSPAYQGAALRRESLAANLSDLYRQHQAPRGTPAQAVQAAAELTPREALRGTASEQATAAEPPAHAHARDSLKGTPAQSASEAPTLARKELPAPPPTARATPRRTPELSHRLPLGDSVHTPQAVSSRLSFASPRTDSYMPPRRVMSTSRSISLGAPSGAVLMAPVPKTVSAYVTRSGSHSARGSDRSRVWSFRAEPTTAEDLINQHVQYFLQMHPDVAKQHCIIKKEAAIYEIDMHEVKIEWQHAAEVGKPGHLVVVDGPLRQPFADYLAMNENNAFYNTNEIARTSSLHQVPKDKRMTFDDTHKKYSRLEAMRVAKEQAKIREQAADYIKEGREVPDDLVNKYKKALRNKVRAGKGRTKSGSKQDEDEAQAALDGAGAKPRDSSSQHNVQEPTQSKERKVAPSGPAKPAQNGGSSIDAPAQKAGADHGSNTPMRTMVTNRCSSVHGLSLGPGVVPVLPSHATGFQGLNRTYSLSNMAPGPVPLLAPTAVATCSMGRAAQNAGAAQVAISPRSPMLSARLPCQPVRTTGSYFPAVATSAF